MGYIYTQRSFTRFEGKWMQLEDITLSEANKAQKDQDRVFSPIHARHPKDKHIHKNKHDHVQTHM
jgi:hypothetical protein